jgi:hypothetical protein
MVRSLCGPLVDHGEALTKKVAQARRLMEETLAAFVAGAGGAVAGPVFEGEWDG